MRNPAAEMEGPAHRDLRNHGEEIRLLVACDKDLQSIVVEASGDSWP
ncbi:MAG: hypothetical protein M3522_07610 [Actinomycetota bacterium]|nr:hypothetical protein [Actinomycetota bacterium]